MTKRNTSLLFLNLAILSTCLGSSTCSSKPKGRKTASNFVSKLVHDALEIDRASLTMVDRDNERRGNEKFSKQFAIGRFGLLLNEATCI